MQSPCYPKRKTKDEQAGTGRTGKAGRWHAIAWLDSRVRQWRENSPKTNKIYVAPVTDEDDEHEPN